jgi:RNase_H superfamily
MEIRMGRKYLAFDIETAKVVPSVDFNWKPHRPLGISCIASHASDGSEPRVWLSRSPAGAPATKMTQQDVATFIRHLADAARDGFVPVSWNGLAFDFDVLAEESGLVDECRRLARSHVDMMFHVVCEKGFRVGLKQAASGMQLAGKLAGVEGIDAPALWAAGKHELVMEYVAQDVRTTLEIAHEAEKRRTFAWTTRKGTIGTMPLKSGWLTVEAALRLPLPDTSWMSGPPSRSDFMSWLEGNS